MANDRPEIVWTARRLLRAARSGTLATADAGQPYASLVTPAPAPDLSLLMLLSGLSPHTRHLRQDGRCALMVVGEPTGPNPQTAPRLSVTGVASPDDDPALKARWIARHPYAAFYADLPDFRVLRLRPTAGQFIGGFGSAHRVTEAELAPDAAAVAALAAAEAAILAEMNAGHRAAVEQVAGGPGWRMTAVDVDGCDLAREEAVQRIAWTAPLADPGDVRAEMMRLVQPADGSAAAAL